jgi:hypothetical protein
MVVLVACLPLAMSHAHAQTDGSRQQVLDELAQARASGNFEVPGELGGLARERFPGQFAQPAAQAPGLTRDAVRGELQAAVQRGELPHGDVDLAAGRAPAVIDGAHDIAQGRTRAQVREELAQAIRRGEVEEAGEAGRLLRDIYVRRYGTGHDDHGATHYAMADGR